ncbi:MAG: radical SAM protein [Deltaproteobacteria bacterium]|nr:radical SAM protein [Deltaproteobacteria bacterium]
MIPEAQISGSLTEGLEIRRRYFPDTIRFHNPGLRRHQTSEISCQQTQEFVSISLTGTRCALDCKHCGTSVLRGMKDLSRSSKNLFELCSELSRSGTRGILISGGCDRYGRVPILPHIPDLIRARRELGMTIRVHPGLPDEETAKGLAELDIDGAMVDIIGNNNTIRDVYHLNAKTEDYDAVMARLNRHDVPLVPHIILGLHFGKMLGEWKALEMTAKHRIKLLVLVILMPLNGTQMQNVSPPSLQEIGAFFNTARKALPQTEIMLGCARPLGKIKIDVDRLAIESGLNGIAFPAEGTLSYARQHGLEPEIINACCGVNWN